MSAQELALQPEASLVETSVGDIMLNPALLQQINQLAEVLSQSKVTVPDHLTGNQADCYAVVLQAVQWRMNPFVVAQKTHIVSGKLGYEAQLVNAVIQASGMIEGRFHYEYQGDGAKLECRVGAIPKGESEIVWNEWLCMDKITTKNSPLWKTNPKQQMGYLQLKFWARQYAPGAILGIYTVDELHDNPPREREVGPGTAQSSELNSILKPEEDIVEIEPEASEPTAATPDSDEDPLTVEEIVARIQAASNQHDLAQVISSATDFVGPEASDDDKKTLNEAYKKRKDELAAIADADPANQ